MAIIAIDFDGTCVTHDYPGIGKPVGSASVLRKLVAAGHQLIIWTMRSGEELEAAKNWFKENEIPFYAANGNPTQKSWTSSPKCYANLYIDDAALGTPLVFNLTYSSRPYVDWVKVEKLLIEQSYLKV